MAYFNLLAAVSESNVERFRSDPTRLMQPSLVLGASHLVSYWVKIQPLGRLLYEALDGGEVVHPDLWHPLRPPLFHRATRVRELTEQMDAAWQAALTGEPLHDGDWLPVEGGRVLRLYRHAAEKGECVVSALNSPSDQERASRIRALWQENVSF